MRVCLCSLPACSYSVASAVGCQEAVCALSTGSFDVVLAEARVLLNGCGQRGAEKDKLIKLIKDKQELPFILMSENPTAAEVRAGCSLTAELHWDDTSEL